MVHIELYHVRLGVDGPVAACRAITVVISTESHTLSGRVRCAIGLRRSSCTRATSEDEIRRWRGWRRNWTADARLVRSAIDAVRVHVESDIVRNGVDGAKATIWVAEVIPEPIG